jgi:hypothetical protein
MVLVLIVFLFGMGTQVITADMTGNPYQGIMERNVFNLRPPARPEDSLPLPEAPPKITLTGFTDILGNKRVLFKVQVPAKPPQPAKEESYILAEGQRDGDVEVLEIDENAGMAKFNNHGTIQTLDLTNNGAKPPSTPLPTIQPPLPFRSPATPTPNPQPPGPAMRTIPGRTLRLPPMPGSPPTRTIPGYPGLQPPGAPAQAAP